MSTTTRRAALAAAALVLATAAPTLAAPMTTNPVPAQTATSAPDACAVRWGSLPKGEIEMTGEVGTVTDVRAGRHACFDRMVVDLGDTDAADVQYLVRYVDRVHEPGTGDPVPLRGGARLQVDVLVPTYDDRGRVVYDPEDPADVVDVSGYRTLRQVALAGSFEGMSTFGTGVRARLPFRVLVLDGPGDGSRLVIDVAHTW